MLTTAEDVSARLAPRPAWDRVGRCVLIAYLAAVLWGAAWLRLWRLDSVPGLNGDEGWYGVQAQAALAGEEFSWTTPTGNVINPFFLGPLVGLHAIFPPSVGLLRAPAVVSGLLAILACYFLAKRVWGSRAAAVAAIVMAILPANIAYSRFAWDASQTALFATLAVLPALIAARRGGGSRRSVWGVAFAWLGLAAAAVVHPTNVFLAPLVALPTWRLLGERCQWAATLRRQPWAPWCAAIVAVGLLAASAVAPWPAVRGAIPRLVSPTDAAEFIRNVGRLMSGDTVYRYLSGSRAPTGGADDPVPRDWVVADSEWLAAALLIAWGWRRLRLAGRLTAADRLLLWGWLWSLVICYLVAGPESLRPHFERYGLWLVAPTAVVAARGAMGLLERSRVNSDSRSYATEFDEPPPGPSRLAWNGPLVIAGIAATCLWIGSFVNNYARVFAATGGDSHRTFRTASVEPKQAALALILSARPAGQRVAIVTEEWWLYWPLKYLAVREEKVDVVWIGEGAARRGGQGTKRRTPRPAATCRVEFAGSEAWSRALASAKQTTRLPKWCCREPAYIADAAGRPLLGLAWTRPPAEKPELEISSEKIQKN